MENKAEKYREVIEDISKEYFRIILTRGNNKEVNRAMGLIEKALEILRKDYFTLVNEKNENN